MTGAEEVTEAAQRRPPGMVRLTDRLGADARKMRQTSEDNYIGDGDYRMQREYGLTPNGNNIGGRWGPMQARSRLRHSSRRSCWPETTKPLSFCRP